MIDKFILFLTTIYHIYRIILVIFWRIWLICLVWKVPAFANAGAGAARTEVISVILVGLQVGWIVFVSCLQDGLTTLLLILHLFKDMRSLATAWRNAPECARVQCIETSWVLILYPGFCSMVWNVCLLLLRCEHLDLYLLLNWNVRPHKFVESVLLL